MPVPIDSQRCPCLSGETYGSCCGPLHRGESRAATAERLMRSRYCAFTIGDARYLLDSWHPSTRPQELELEAGIRWFRLDIDQVVRGGPFDTEGTVEFTAHYREASAGGARVAGSQHESSRFVKHAGQWFYVDGIG